MNTVWLKSEYCWTNPKSEYCWLALNLNTVGLALNLNTVGLTLNLNTVGLALNLNTVGLEINQVINQLIRIFISEYVEALSMKKPNLNQNEEFTYISLLKNSQI